MGGGPCKVAIDDGNGEGMALLFGKTLATATGVIKDLWPYLSKAEKKEAVRISNVICEFASGPLREANDLVLDFYVAMGKKYEDREIGEGPPS